MIEPDFSKYSIALIKEGEVVYSATGCGIRPLVQCILDLKGGQSGCILHDKVIGLAAARLAVWSGMVNEIVAGMLSQSAKDYLSAMNFPFSSKRIVSIILDRDQLGVCPMEVIAGECPDDEEMWARIREKLGM